VWGSPGPIRPQPAGSPCPARAGRNRRASCSGNGGRPRRLEGRLGDGVAAEKGRDRLEIGDFPGRAAAGHSVSSSLGQGWRSSTSMWGETVLPASVLP
jgi:hypothetical protein